MVVEEKTFLGARVPSQISPQSHLGLIHRRLALALDPLLALLPLFPLFSLHIMH